MHQRLGGREYAPGPRSFVDRLHSKEGTRSDDEVEVSGMVVNAEQCVLGWQRCGLNIWASAIIENNRTKHLREIVREAVFTCQVALMPWDASFRDKYVSQASIPSVPVRSALQARHPCSFSTRKDSTLIGFGGEKIQVTPPRSQSSPLKPFAPVNTRNHDFAISTIATA